MAEKKSSNAVNQPRRQEKPFLMWFDKGNSETNHEEYFNYFNDVERCFETVHQSIKPIFIVLNSSSATDLLSRIHSLSQIDTIFIYCQSTREHQRSQYLLQHYSKIFDLFIDRKQMIDVICENVNLHEKNSGNDYLRLGESYRAKNEFSRAIKYTQKALDIFRKTLTNQNHPIIARCLNNLGGIYDAQGDANRSFEYYEQAIKIYTHLTPQLSNQPVSNFVKK